MTLILFLSVLFILILVHELGHFVVAKLAKMRVDEFAIGFPPRLFGIKKGETEYAVNLLPIGGYVKIFGENGSPTEAGARAFGARPRYLQAAVLLAGVFMNILTAWLIFFAVAQIGEPTLVESSDDPNAKLVVVATLDRSPANEAKFPLGAEIIGLESEGEKEIPRQPADISAFVARHGEAPIEITYRDGGRSTEMTITPKKGLAPDEPDRAILGISSAQVETTRANPLEAVASATTRTMNALYAITVGVFSLIASSFTFSADLSQVTGPVGIAGMVGDAAEFGFVSLLIFTAFISLNLAVINLLPIPALDGGRLLFVLAEAILRRPIDPEWMTRVNFVGFALLMLLMIAVTYNDLVKIF